MELTHTFTVPTSVEDTWTHFQDIAAVAECFPGAQVTSADGDTFQGTCKVKLGPIALVYAGSGTFVERDEEAHAFVVEAKGKDKRGNGTAGATVQLSMAASDGGGTTVEVLTDLAITGKPAQFGRGVMQDVSDKLLGQFVACLEERLGTAGDRAPAAAEEAGDAAAGGQEDVSELSAAAPAAPPAAAQPPPAPVRSVPSGSSGSSNDEALDLGATVLPVLLKSYGKQAAAALLGLLAVRWVVRRLRR